MKASAAPTGRHTKARKRPQARAQETEEPHEKQEAAPPKTTHKMEERSVTAVRRADRRPQAVARGAGGARSGPGIIHNPAPYPAEEVATQSTGKMAQGAGERQSVAAQ